MIYNSIYRCSCCVGFTHPNGVHDFVVKGPRQTIPVSHFGDIEKSKIWLILTNPKGDRNDANVGHLVSSYNVPGREDLSSAQVESIFQHFSTYFQRPGVNIHQFFNRFIEILDGLIVGGQQCTFQNGGVCAVDVIKCPTITDFQRFVRLDEGKKVWYKCLGRIRHTGPNHFIIRQIEKHNPPILIFAQSTAGLIGVNYKGNRKGCLQGLNTMKIFIRRQNPKRLSIDLGSYRGLTDYLGKDRNNSKKLHDAIQKAINDFTSI